MNTQMKPKMVTDANGKKKLGMDVKVQPTLVMDGQQVGGNGPEITMTNTFDPKLKKRNGQYEMDMGMQTQGMKVKKHKSSSSSSDDY